MKDQEQKKDVFQTIDQFGEEDYYPTLKEYFKIAALTLVLPFSFFVLLNEGALIGKLISWLQNEVPFWEHRSKIGLAIIIGLFPILHFYRLTIVAFQKALYQMREDFFLSWFDEAGDLVSGELINWYEKGQAKEFEFDIATLKVWFNKKINRFPKPLKWAANKLFDKIPIVNIFNSYSMKDLEEGNQEAISLNIANKLDDMVLEMIDAYYSFYFKLVIPANILFLFLFLMRS